MTNFLEYRPHLEYKRRLQAVLREYGTGEFDWVEGGDDDISQQPGAFPSELLSGKGYTPSTAIEEAVDLTPTDTLMKYVETIGKIDALIDKIVEKLRKDVTAGLPIDEYIKAREENNLDIVHEFEDFHSDNLEGSTAAEVLPPLFRFKEELESIGEFIGDYLFPGELNQDLGYLAEQLERLRREEEEEMKKLIEEDRNIQLDEDRLKEKNHILEFLYRRADSIGGFVDDVDGLISVTPREVYHGSGERVALMAARQSVLRKEFTRMTSRRFMKFAKNASDANQRMMRLADVTYKKTLLEETVKLQKEKLESRDALQAVYAENPQSEDDMLNIFFMDLVDEIEGTKAECDGLVEDLYRISELEDLQNIDYLNSLEGKNACRHTDFILKRIEGLDANDANLNREIEKLFQ